MLRSRCERVAGNSEFDGPGQVGGERPLLRLVQDCARKLLQNETPHGIKPFSKAWRSRSSRNSGWAREMSACARSATDFPFRFTMPYSVTTYITSERGVVTMFPGVR